MNSRSIVRMVRTTSSLAAPVVAAMLPPTATSLPPDRTSVNASGVSVRHEIAVLLSVFQNECMLFRCLIIHLAVSLALCSQGYAQTDAAGYFSVPGADAPELAGRGSHSVGVRTLEFVNPGQVDILNFDQDDGKGAALRSPSHG